MHARMIVVAGPPGSGKSTLFPASSFGVDSFNADDRAGELNNGSHQGIPLEIRSQVNQEFEEFVRQHIRDKKNFAIETTLRSDITFKQALEAHAQGFRVEMLYVALRDFGMNLTRVKARAIAGGHSASADQLLDIHRKSLGNLAEAIRGMDGIQVMDNSAPGGEPLLLLEAQDGRVTYLAEETPDWLAGSLRGTQYELGLIRRV